ncbi:hypothetical protein BOTBODRAFT_226934 [Botryobasidium botryosum FD-172 SS1]|uniref:Uncharacterized protein n=1 Tax=Botryobasidium botryosum (strain FD-172 SS1) TaxID=930990 RepID=A0A067M628_BOTB1|nr:hypothetical protein BOTBODRAFT_226934 [Botryobasidium botryosum FD-172 SS1]
MILLGRYRVASRRQEGAARWRARAGAFGLLSAPGAVPRTTRRLSSVLVSRHQLRSGGAWRDINELVESASLVIAQYSST